MRSLGKRVVVVGVSASGKSVFSRKLAQRTGLPLKHMDSIIWKPGWVYAGDDVVDRWLEEVTTEDSWIIEGYITKASRTTVFERADTILYMDYSPWVASWRYLKRWWRHRKDARPEIEGCPEKFSFKFLKLVWAKGEAITLKQFLKNVGDQSKIVTLRSPREAKKYLTSL